jgi:ADP-ribose pyrophosphatase YjhB (NUDIX family)
MTAAVEVAVGAVAVHEGALLLIERGRGPGAGRWSLPGGRVQFGETLHEAVVREVAEETGLTVTVESFVGWAERMGDEPEPYHYVILDFVVRVHGPALPLRAGDDATAAAWVPIGDVAAWPVVPGLVDFLEQHEILMAAR